MAVTSGETNYDKDKHIERFLDGNWNSNCIHTHSHSHVCVTRTHIDGHGPARNADADGGAHELRRGAQHETDFYTTSTTTATPRPPREDGGDVDVTMELVMIGGSSDLPAIFGGDGRTNSSTLRAAAGSPGLNACPTSHDELDCPGGRQRTSPVLSVLLPSAITGQLLLELDGADGATADLRTGSTT